MINFGKLKNIINSNSSFLLTTHVNPDGDAIGSELALSYFLNKLNKEVRIINYSPTPHYLQFLDERNLIEQFTPESNHSIYESNVLVALDFNQPNRIKTMGDIFTKSNSIKICIDHHAYPNNFVNELFIDTDYNATGEIVYDLIAYYGIEYFDKNIADTIYAAIMTDTGSFRFQRMTPKVHLIAAHLLELNVDPSYIYNRIYNELSFEKLKLLGDTIATMKSTANGKISYLVITQEMLANANAIEEDIEGFVNYTLSISDTEFGLLFLELKDGIKISLRSKGTLSVNKFAQEFGGGGHINAAGIRLYGTNYDAIIDNILTSARNYLLNRNTNA